MAANAKCRPTLKLFVYWDRPEINGTPSNRRF
jgi:hypothetical protein